ncbi:uncharacterized protein LOC106077233 [Biomphalaria glabrata]|uniref:Uncharacterized protein LOC106077233 n=2 Tax=Biomphalaria glabrata TaxID=6526 RepID=A0A9W3AZT5_BIOGL
MATAVIVKKVCEFGAKCYRKNKQHREDYSHPDQSTTDKPRLVHDISVNEDDPPRLTRRTSKRKLEEEANRTAPTPSNEVSNSTATASAKISTLAGGSPKKKTKTSDTSEEKITVNYCTKKKENSSAREKENDKGENSATVTNTPKTIPKTIKYEERREKCEYWEKCYRNSEDHKKQFYHPNDKEDKSGDIKEDGKTPINPLEDGGTVEFNSGYKLTRDGDIYSCTCKGFLSQRKPINERTCKHLKEYLGEEFEKCRQKANHVPRPSGIQSHINVSLLLAHKYDEKVHNPVGWWISEKLDGVRAFWNGRCFYSRLGNAFYAPAWFTKDLPKDMHLDGELFGGRGEFQSTVSIVKTAESPKWKDIKYHVFDSPHMGKEVFEKRMHLIKEYFEDVQPEHAVFVEQTKCKSKEHLEEKMTRILNLGGEGLMIRQPKSVYEACRSKTLLKIKKFYDAEAIVIGHEAGKGSNQHRCGALRCKMACGKEFSVGSGLTNKDRDHPPKIGTIITYKFQELSKGGSPRFPTFLGICIDKTEPKDAEIREVLNEDEV